MDAAHRPCVAKWWWEPRTRTAIIESAAVIGLAMLPPKRFHPFQLDTLGLGAVVRAAAKKGAQRCLMGIGGSATNDGGFGLARALGWEFLDRKGQLIERWTDLHRLERIRAPQRRRWFRQLARGDRRAESAAWPARRDPGLRTAEGLAPAGFRAGRALPGPVGAGGPAAVRARLWRASRAPAPPAGWASG